MEAANSKDLLLPREAAKFINEQSKHVKVVPDGIKDTAKIIFDRLKKGSTDTDVKRWQTHELNPKTGDKVAVDWIFLSDLLNFSFWSEDESKKYIVKYNGKGWTGYWSMCAAINRALDEGIAFTDPAYYRSIKMEELRNIFRSDSDTDMPLIEERLKVLHEAGTILCNKYDGSFINVIKKSERSAQKLLEIIVNDFTSFQDVTEFQGQKVAIYKRAQILIADTWACCKGEGYGEFFDIDTITMFADYRIPQALVWFGALKYSKELLDILKDPDHRFKSGDRQEVEIRGGSIYAVDLIVEELKKMIKEDVDISDDLHMNAILIDHFLWDYRREHAPETEHIPIHKIRCIYY